MLVKNTHLSRHVSGLRSFLIALGINAEALCIAHVGILARRERIARYLDAARQAAAAYRAKIETCLDRFSGDQDRVVEAIVAEEYDAREHHILNRNPFITNLQAKIKAICKLAEK